MILAPFIIAAAVDVALAGTATILVPLMVAIIAALPALLTLWRTGRNANMAADAHRHLETRLGTLEGKVEAILRLLGAEEAEQA